ncbi:MAG TPA: D-glycero-beta-D-manno-heptose 1,7-bisphosphate 7-phosphatase [Gammaproteobacteria bacterium]|nr:D-glycero-beta-D-manno-heptose 1,7-bisphosphate 7-phosphatase [Gammaproteobacteria bacterium]
MSRRASAARRLVILDRDGVINEDSPDYVTSPEGWRPLPGSLEAIADLCRAGFEVVVATNQAGIARGLLSEADLEAIHVHMREAVARAGGRLAGIYYCPHHPEEGCACRKPMPGLLEQAAADFGGSLEGVPFIGDKLTDVLAAEAAGARPICVRSSLWSGDYDAAAARGAEVYPDLRRAADALLAE